MTTAINAARKIVLITGANSGLGFEIAAQLLHDPTKHVLLGCRSGSKGQTALSNLAFRNLPGTVEYLPLDITSTDSITAAVETVRTKYTRLDTLINNAAIGFPPGPPSASFSLSFATNATSAYLVTSLFAPLLSLSPHTPRIINVTSGAGFISFAQTAPALPYHRDQPFAGLEYATSKAALNMITVMQARVYGEMGWKVFAYSPGFVVSNLGPQNRVEDGADPTVEGARPVVGIVDGERDGEHGLFLRRVGTKAW